MEADDLTTKAQLAASRDRIRVLEDEIQGLIGERDTAWFALNGWRGWASYLCSVESRATDATMRDELNSAMLHGGSRSGELVRLRTMETYFDAVIGAVDSYREVGKGKYARGSYANAIRREDIERANAGQEKLATAIERLTNLLDDAQGNTLERLLAVLNNLASR